MSDQERRSPPASPALLAWRRLLRNRAAIAGSVALALLYLVTVFAGFFSPYSPTDQEFRDHFFHPPTPLRFSDSNGFHFRPYVTTTYLADAEAIRYATGSPASLCLRQPGSNLNPYLREKIEGEPAVSVYSGTVLLSEIRQLQEGSENSGVFCGPLGVDPFRVAAGSNLTVTTFAGVTEQFPVVSGAAAPIADAAGRGVYLLDAEGRPCAGYSNRVERYPLRFFVHGFRYRVLWLFESDLHLFGTEEPAHVFLLGTDQSGRDQWSRVLYGAQISLTVGLFGVLLTTVLGLFFGGIAGYYGGNIDAALMRFAEVLLSIPGLYLILSIRNIIPDRLQELYDRIRRFGSETFAWQDRPLPFAAVLLVSVLLLSYYCHRGGWRRSRVAASAAALGVLLFGKQLFAGALAALQVVLPGTTHLTSEWTYLMIVLILSAVGWAGMARVIRGMVLSLRESDYVVAARALGAGDMRILARHVLPNTFGYVIVRATYLIPAYILGEVALSFLALGVQEPVPSWGNMLTQAQNLRILTQFSWTLAPGAFIFVTVLAYNILGDGLRDALDPRWR